MEARPSQNEEYWMLDVRVTMMTCRPTAVGGPQQPRVRTPNLQLSRGDEILLCALTMVRLNPLFPVAPSSSVDGLNGAEPFRGTSHSPNSTVIPQCLSPPFSKLYIAQDLIQLCSSLLSVQMVMKARLTSDRSHLVQDVSLSTS